MDDDDETENDRETRHDLARVDRMTTGRPWPIACLLLLLLLLAGCQPVAPDEDLRGRVTLWHSWSGAEAVELREALARFQEVYPGVRVVELALPEDQILKEFTNAARDGLAPDILIGRNRWIKELVDAGLIRALVQSDAPQVLANARNRALVAYEGELFGVPLFLAPRALYFNKSLVSEPAASLDDLLREAAAGNRVEFVPRFEEAYWGIQTFGHGLFDAGGNFTLAGSGFEEWLRWLDNAQRQPGVILNVDDESLLDLFAAGQIAYYISGPDSLARILERMDEENAFEVGVAPLPGGPDGPSGPLVPAETIMFYTHGSPGQARIAKELAAFLADERQGIRFMRQLGKVPANPRIQVDRRIYPFVSGFAQQARTAVVLPLALPVDPLVAAGNRAYTSVLSGSATAADAVCQFGREVVALLGDTGTEPSLPAGCELPES